MKKAELEAQLREQAVEERRKANEKAADRRVAAMEKVSAFFLGSPISDIPADLIKRFPAAGKWFTEKVNSITVTDIFDLADHINSLQASSEEQLPKFTTKAETFSYFNTILDNIRREREDKIVFNDVYAPFLRNPANDGTYYRVNDPISNKLEGEIDELTGNIMEVIDKGEPVEVTLSAKKKIITTKLTASVRGFVELSGRPFNKFNKGVYNTLSTLYRMGVRTFIPENICNLLNGRDPSDKATLKEIGEVIDALEVLRHIYAYCDISTYLQRRGIVDKKTIIVIDDYILSLRRVVVKTTAGIKLGYSFNCKPLLLEFAETVKQVKSFPTELQDIKQVKICDGGRLEILQNRRVPTSKERTKIREELIEHIDNIVKGYYRNQNIDLINLYTKCEIPIEDRRATQRAREYIGSCFLYWQALGYIGGYYENIDGKRISGYKIVLPLVTDESIKAIPESTSVKLPVGKEIKSKISSEDPAAKSNTQKLQK